MKSTYIYNNTEVKCTGRVAVKTKVERKDGKRVNSELKLYEVTPADPEQGSWVNWVALEDLYIIMEDDN
jgi:hypothetical protein